MTPTRTRPPNSAACSNKVYGCSPLPKAAERLAKSQPNSWTREHAREQRESGIATDLLPAWRYDRCWRSDREVAFITRLPIRRIASLSGCFRSSNTQTPREPVRRGPGVRAGILGGTLLPQHHPLERTGPRRSLRRLRAAGAVRSRDPRLLPRHPMTVASLGRLGQPALPVPRADPALLGRRLSPPLALIIYLRNRW